MHEIEIFPSLILLLYEAWAILSETELVSLQPLGADHATLPHMKAMHVPFHLVYGSLISLKGLQSDRPKSRGMSVYPRQTSKMIIKYLSVGQKC